MDKVAEQVLLSGAVNLRGRKWIVLVVGDLP